MGSKRSRVRLPLKEYKKLCELVHERDGWKCRVCRFRQDLHAHHIVFRSQRGPDATFNLVTVCSDCHEAIHSRYVIILAKSGKPDDPVNADEGIKILRVNGWKPKRTVR
jgi:5-methylcytosine-specific restriction endonuclease McrA